MNETITISLKEQYQKLKSENPKMRIRNMAHELQVSEAQLQAWQLGNGSIRLEPKFQEILKDILSLGEVMALTRNDSVVHERKGVYDNVSFEGPVGLAVNPDIDLRLFMMHWKYAFAVSEGERKSIQIFDKSGTAVHKIYLTAKSDTTAFDELVARYTATEQIEQLDCQDYPPVVAELSDAEIDIPAFQQAWRALKDTHDFFGMTKRFKVSRTQALRLAPEEYVQKIAHDSPRRLLQLAAERQVPIMVFVGNRGCIQIHTGTVEKLMEAGPWYNVLDPMFNLHLNEQDVDAVYIVKKPSTDGIVTAVEVFDKHGEMIVQFFGKRKPGIPELEDWRSLLIDLYS